MSLGRFFKQVPPAFSQRMRAYSTRISHVTDSEGTLFALDSMKRSHILTYHPERGIDFAKQSGTPHFIFGGDATDRGAYDLTFLELLLDFKRRFPEQVHLLSGNREIKHGRFAVELAPQFIRERLLKTEMPYWLKNSPLPKDYVLAEMAKTGHAADTVDAYVTNLSIEQCQLIYLHWMLEKTMGSPHTFRFRREELARRQQRSTVSDLDVLQSFLQETKPTGLMGEYLQQGQLGVIIPQTGVLAVHGGITAENVGRVPDMQPTDPIIPNANTWIAACNTWYHRQIEKWKTYQPTQFTIPGFTDLDKTVLPVIGKPKSIITADMLGHDRQFVTIPTDVSDYLNRNNISIVLTGHQPSGDHPALLRSADNSVLFINGDTGYAKINPAQPTDTRCNANHTLEIAADQQGASIHLEAILPDQTTPIVTDLEIAAKQIQGDAYLGRIVAGDQLVQCRLPNGDYRLAQQQGIHTRYSTMPADQLAQLLSRTETTFKK